MLSSVLRNPRALMVNIEMMRTLVRLQRMLASNSKVRKKLDAFAGRYDTEIKKVFDVFRELSIRDSDLQPGL